MRTIFKILFVLLAMVVIYLFVERIDYNEQFQRSEQTIDSLSQEITYRDSIIVVIDTELDSIYDSNEVLKWKLKQSNYDLIKISEEYEIKKAQRDSLPIDSIVSDIAKYLRAKY